MHGQATETERESPARSEVRPSVNYQIFDTAVIGFAAWVQASGVRTFTIDYRHAERQRRMTIGRSPEWSVTVARERAKELRHAIDKGQDPLSVKDDLREALRVKDMIDRYIAEHLPKLAKSNAADQVSMLKKHAGTGLGQQAVGGDHHVGCRTLLRRGGRWCFGSAAAPRTGLPL